MDYANILKNVVLPKLDQFGRSLKIIKKTSAIGSWEKFYDYEEMKYRWKNTETGEIVDVVPSSTTIEVEHTVKGILDNFTTREIDGTFIKAGDIRIYLQPTVEPVNGDFIEFDNKRYSIYNVQTLQPAELVLMYTLFVRNA